MFRLLKKFLPLVVYTNIDALKLQAEEGSYELIPIQERIQNLEARMSDYGSTRPSDYRNTDEEKYCLRRAFIACVTLAPTLLVFILGAFPAVNGCSVPVDEVNFNKFSFSTYDSFDLFYNIKFVSGEVYELGHSGRYFKHAPSVGVGRYLLMPSLPR